MGDFLDEKPRPKPSKHEIGQDLSLLSLHERVTMLEEEIVRLKEARAKKDASRTAADGFFKR
jgi:uncharacterized small protein (DUF1192 family)